MDIKGLRSAKLRDAETMLACLVKVDGNSHYREAFYPILTKQASRQLNGMGVIICVQMAIVEYAADLPPEITTTMQLQVLDFAEAIMTDNEVVRDARKFFDEVERACEVKKTHAS